MTRPVPLSVLDLSPIVSGGSAARALRESIDLARHAERLGYLRYWVAEHHFTPGVASTAPTVLIGQIAAATSVIRVGSAAVQTGHQTPLAVVEQFAMLDALFPGRIDLGLGRSGQRRAEVVEARRPEPAPVAGARVVDGLLIPEAFPLSRLFRSPRLRALYPYLQQPGAETPDYAEQVEQVLGLVDGTLRTADGFEVEAAPSGASGLDVWVFGSSAGASAEVAGARGLPFGANYHVSPATLLEAVDAYRAAFRPSARLAEPYVAVSADVVVAEDDATARRLASPYAVWVRSIRSGCGAMPFPTPEEAERHPWTEADHELVADRVATQFVGSPTTVAERLETLARVTGADELIVTTITHDHADRVRSHELLAEVWTADRARRSEALAR